MMALLLTQKILSADCRGPESLYMALGATTETTGKKLPTGFYVHDHKHG